MITVNAQFTRMTAFRILPVPVTLYLLMVILPIRFMVGPWQVTGLRFYAAVMLVPLAIAALRRAPAATDLLLPLFVLWAGVCMVVNTPGQAFEHTGAVFLELCGGYFIARSYIRSSDQFQALAKVLVILVICALPLALFETLTGSPPIIQAIRTIPGITSVDIVDIAPRLGLDRAQVAFAHPIHFGLFCSAAVSLLFVGLSDVLSLSIRIVGVALICLATFLALSSGAYLSAAIQLFLIAWMIFFRHTQYKWWLLVCLSAGAYVFVDLVSNRTPIRVFMSYATFSAHNAYWRSLIFEWGLVNVGQNPLFGLGLNDWQRPHFMYSGSMDNYWLALGVRYGLPGFGLMALAWVLGLLRVARGKTGLAHIRAAWLFCMIGLTCTLATVHIWTAIYSFTFFLLGAGQWMGEVRNKRPEHSPEKIRYSRPFQTRFERPLQLT